MPAVSFGRSIARWPPAPDNSICPVASCASTYFSGGASELPPEAAKAKSTWSFLKSVGLSHASTPFDSRTTVTPSSGISRRPMTVPGSGKCASRTALLAVSAQGVTAVASADAIAAMSCSGDGAVTPAFWGATPRITRLVSANMALAAVATSAAVIVGTSACTSLCSYSIPGVGSPCRKWFTYSCTYDPLSVLSRSA